MGLSLYREKRNERVGETPFSFWPIFTDFTKQREKFNYQPPLRETSLPSLVCALSPDSPRLSEEPMGNRDEKRRERGELTNAQRVYPAKSMPGQKDKGGSARAKTSTGKKPKKESPPPPRRAESEKKHNTPHRTKRRGKKTKAGEGRTFEDRRRDRGSSRHRRERTAVHTLHGQ